MGWFGSLGLAYKYAIVFGSLLVLVILAGSAKLFYNRRRLKKFTQKAELEASGVREERVELNARELDEGDLFGIRAIQSGYFGGVAQSRPVSEAGSHSPNESISRAFLGSHPSPTLIATSPMTSVTALPLDARQSSPLGQPAFSPNELGRTATPQRPALRPFKSGLQPSEAELSGRINHDPAVNMSLEIPPSPLTPTRPQIPASNAGSRAITSPGSAVSSAGSRSPSPSYPFPAPNNKLNPISTGSHLQNPPSENVGSARPVSTAEVHNQPVHSQSASIISKSSDSSNHDEPRSPRPGYSELPTRPARTIHPERSTSYGSYRPPRTSSIPRAASPSIVHQHRDEPGPIPPSLRVGPAAGDWGNDIFREIDQSIHDSKSMAVPSNQQAYSNHASKLSDSSSIYSSSNAGQRYSTKQLSIDSKSHSQTPSTLPSSAPSATDGQHPHPHPATLPEGTRRGSDASCHQYALSNQSTGDGSHRHTKELGDFYDSYWRQSHTGPLPNRAGDMGKSHPSGFSGPRLVGDMGKESRRPGQMDLKVATIAEVPTPLSSPMPGTAL